MKGYEPQSSATSIDNLFGFNTFKGFAVPPNVRLVDGASRDVAPSNRMDLIQLLLGRGIAAVCLQRFDRLGDLFGE